MLHRVVFVLKELPDKWISNGSTDFTIQLKPPDFSEVSDKALAAEGSYSHWSLFDRFCLVNELLDASDSAGDRPARFMIVDMFEQQTAEPAYRADLKHGDAFRLG